MSARPWRKRRQMTPRRLAKQRWQPGWPSCWQWDTEAEPLFDVKIVVHPVVTHVGYGGWHTMTGYTEMSFTPRKA